MKLEEILDDPVGAWYRTMITQINLVSSSRKHKALQLMEIMKGCSLVNFCQAFKDANKLFLKLLRNRKLFHTLQQEYEKHHQLLFSVKPKTPPKLFQNN